MMNNLLKRTISGTVFMIVMVAGLLVNRYVFTALVLFMTAGMLFEFYRQKGSAALLAAGTVYILCSEAILYFTAFTGGSFSGILPLCFFVLIWSSDVGAYCIGSTLGKKFCSRKLAPKISPAKTWAGFWGGMLFCMAAAAILQMCAVISIPLVHALIIGALVHSAGVAGDLLESAWKRHCGIKDSGNLIPGHGGLLDRFDSSLLAIPVGVLYLIIFNLICL